jgi:hypothetical protein
MKNSFPAGFAVPSSYIHAFSCTGQQAGVIKVDPDGDPCPPYSITYNQVNGGVEDGHQHSSNRQ